MSETSPKCNRCGVPLPPDAPEGLCPRCLVALNLATQTDVTGEAGPHGTVAGKTPPAPPLPPAEVAKLFPQLEILECLGRGGMGAVYKARQPRLDRLVALKILSPEKQDDPKFAERFEREARALARLSHPNIVTVYDFGQAQGNCYLLMEFVDGLTLRQLFHTRKLAPAEALNIVPKICEALQYAHNEGIVHRDIKPENILLDKKGQVKIADFGIAKIIGQAPKDGSLTGAKDVVGTPHYMAPEQIEKPATVDHRADIYSLGVVFYEMLTGELPLGKFQPPSQRVQVDVRLDEVVMRSLEKEPQRRYQQVSEVKTQVETIAATPESSRSRREEAQTEKAENSQRLHASFPAPFSNVLVQFVAIGAAMVVVCLVLLLGMSSEAIGARTWSYFRLSFEILAVFGSMGFLFAVYRAIKTKTPEARRAVKSAVPWMIVMTIGILFGFWSPHLLSVKSDFIGQASFPKAEVLEEGKLDVVKPNQGTHVSPEQLVNQPKLNEQIFAAKAQIIRRRAQLEMLSKLDNAQLRDVLPEVTKDSLLDRLLRDLDMAQLQIKLLDTTNNSNAKVQQLNDYIAAMNKKIDDLMAGLLAGLKAQLESQQAALDDLKSKLAQTASVASGDESILADQPPVVVETQPIAGTRDVQPGETEIRVRFSKEMADGSWSWSTAWQNSTPESIGPPHYLADQRTCVMKVRLEPGRTYAWWLNSDKFKNFTDLAGRPAVPYLLIFETRK
jgi:tRNA A-37 threonylcarbamoyl transferase component Bud32